MDIEKILTYLPHRYPFVLIDRVIECEPRKAIVALKNVSYNEPFFPGHFPHHPVMPGVLIVEALAQAAGVLALASLSTQPEANAAVYLAGVDNARFKKPVVPGDQLILEVSYQREKGRVWKFSGEAKVDDKTVAGADIMAALATNRA